MLHAAKAALYVHDVATASHAAVRRMFGLHLIQSGEQARAFLDRIETYLIANGLTDGDLSSETNPSVE